MSQSPQDSIPVEQIEKRRHKRYRIKERLFIRRENGQSYPATTSEISISGMSASTEGVLRVEEEVHLSPVVGEQISAIVRRKVGTIYGFEFTNVPDKVVESIHILCRGLVPFRTLADD
jgi:hypothetical protein